MKRLISVIIPLILLVSCSPSREDATQSGTPTATQGVSSEEKIAPLLDSKEALENIWSGFSLPQTDDETFLSYSGKTVKTWSHTPPEKVPFIWDEACVDFFEAMEMVPLEIQAKNPNWKQEAWDKFDLTTRKNCMREYLKKSIATQGVTERFIRIMQSFYETGDSWIYDIESGNIQKIPEVQWVLTIEESPDNIKIHVKNERGPIGWYDVIYDTGFSKLLTEKIYSYEEMNVQ